MNNSRSEDENAQAKAQAKEISDIKRELERRRVVLLEFFAACC